MTGSADAAVYGLQGLRVRSTLVLAGFPLPGDACDVEMAVIVLRGVARAATGVELRPVTGAQALARLAGAARVPGWTDPGVMRRKFFAPARAVREVPVVEAVLPWGPASRSAIAPALLDLLHEKG